MTKLFSKTFIASFVAFSAAGANAAAFQLAEVSTSGLGMAYAGNAAVADNASVVANNPALMTQFKQAELSAGGTLVDTDLTIRGRTSLGNDAYAGNVVPTSFIPNAYFLAPITDDFAIGMGYNVNYGLKTEYENNYNAGSLAGKTELAAHNFNLSAAYKLGAGFSIGAGVNAVYSKAEVRRTLGDKGVEAATQARAGANQLTAAAQQATAGAQLATANGLTDRAAELTATAAALNARAAQANALANYYGSLPAETEITRITGNEWSFGWNAGLTYEFNENHRWGLAYRSPVDVKFKGHYRNALAQNLGSVIATNGQDVDGKLTLYLPAYWELSGYHKLTDKFAVQYSWKRTEWSRLKTLDAYSLDDQFHYMHKQESFRDTNRYAIGISYDLNEVVTLRTGVAYDRSASVDHPSISIPDTNRMWYSVGGTFRITPDLSLDAAYTHLRGTSFSFNEDGASFNTKARGHLYGLNLNYKF